MTAVEAKVSPAPITPSLPGSSVPSPELAKPNAAIAMARKRRKSVVADFEMAIAEELMKGAGEKTSARS